MHYEFRVDDFSSLERDWVTAAGIRIRCCAHEGDFGMGRPDATSSLGVLVVRSLGRTLALLFKRDASTHVGFSYAAAGIELAIKSLSDARLSTKLIKVVALSFARCREV